MSNSLNVLWDDHYKIGIELIDNPVASYYYDCVKHLRHLDLEFNERSNPFELYQADRSVLVKKLLQSAASLGVEINPARCDSQDYLNQIHDIYFHGLTNQQSEFNPNWLEFHNFIHAMECANGSRPPPSSIWFNYQHKAGLLEKKFDQSWLEKYAVTHVDAGTCFFMSFELGKSLDVCYQDNENCDLDTLCRISRPWTTLSPIMCVSIRDYDSYQEFMDKEQSSFLKWLDPVKKQWCHFWNVPGWQPWHLFAKIPIGKVSDFENFEKKFKSLEYPKRIVPCV